MTRSVGLPVALALLAVVAFSQAQDAYTIKFKETSPGDIVEVDEQSTEQIHIKVADAAGKPILDRAETKVKNFAYRETVLERPDPQKRPTRLKRHYSRAEVKAGDKSQPLPYQGQTVLIEKKDGKYRFQLEGGKELTGPDAQYLDNEFNKERTSDAEMRKLLLPGKPVRVGESWKIDPEPLLKELTRGEEATMNLDAAKATAGGKLLEVYQKDRAQFGKMEFLVEVPIKEFVQGNQKLALQPGALIRITLTADLCIDGSLQTGVMKGNVSLTATGVLPTPDGGQGKLTIASKFVGHEQRKELPRK
ncbi:MAG TPA: hypothetical protein VNK04_11765 [Gemmataceae bacterium]|nr:hypothetical protein [Gemmataceae bacterium]